MLGRLVAAQFDLENALTELSRNGSNTAQADTQLQNLGAMMRQVGTANPALLAGLRGEIGAIIAQSATVAQQARVAASAPQAADIAELASASRAQVSAVMHGMKDFEPYLRFANAEDEADYRRREAERRAIIEAEHAKGTPEGNLNAAGAAVGQMADAAAHGVANRPEFQQRWDELVATTARLRDAAKANGVSTEEFDRRLRDDLRRILKAKGLSDTEIDKHFDANPDPLEAAKALVVDGDDINAVTQRLSAANAVFTVNSEAIAEPQAAVTSDADALAAFRAAGITVSETSVEGGYAHGVNLADVPSRGAVLR